MYIEWSEAFSFDELLQLFVMITSMFFITWTIHVSDMGLPRQKCMRWLAWILGLIYTAVSLYGAWNIFVLHQAVDMDNKALIGIGIFGLVLIFLFCRWSLERFKEAQMRSVIAKDL